MIDDYYVVFCVRDQVKSIDQVMVSLENQTIKPQKIVVIDDNSSDGTSEILLKHKNKHDCLIKLIKTNSTTKDFSRLPKLWNMGLDRKFSFHWIGAGDNIYEPTYAEKILKEFYKDPNLVIASGDIPPYVSKSPLGGGRFVKQKWFFKNYSEYIWKLGYESEILYRAVVQGFNSKVFSHAKLEHAYELGTSHNFTEFGWGMRSMEYYPLYVLLRILSEFIKGHKSKRGVLNMFYYYLTFRPQKTGYYSKWPKEITKPVRESQKKYCVYLIKRILIRPWLVKKLFHTNVHVSDKS